MLDLLHNFFLENSARTNKLRVYQMTKDPAAREMLGYLFVRGGVHAMRTPRQLKSSPERISAKMLPIPKIGNEIFPEAKKYMDMGIHTKLYRFSPDDYREIGQIWQGTVARRGRRRMGRLASRDGGDHAELAGIGSAFAPDYHPRKSSRWLRSFTRWPSRSLVARAGGRSYRVCRPTFL